MGMNIKNVKEVQIRDGEGKLIDSFHLAQASLVKQGKKDDLLILHKPKKKDGD